MNGFKICKDCGKVTPTSKMYYIDMWGMGDKYKMITPFCISCAECITNKAIQDAINALKNTK